MKIKMPLLFITSLLGAISSRAVTPGSISTVTLAITGSKTIESDANTETLQKGTAVTSKYTNAQFLSDLYTEGYLTSGVVPSDTSATAIKAGISGWLVVMVDRSPLLTDDGSTFVLYVVKSSTGQKVGIPASRFNFMPDTGVSSETYTQTSDGMGTPLTSTQKFTSLVKFTLSQDDDGTTYDTTIHGVATGGSSSKTVTLGGTPYLYNLYSAVKINPILGDSSSTTDSTLLQGSISFGAFSAIDISTYPDPNAP
ncbi:MAG TPA: hypothetical protein VL357_06380 [Rariglobus sp.]|jgi:hypothetical protein|nr:hypothetical protein [Rariglobus sp.]